RQGGGALPRQPRAVGGGDPLPRQPAPVRAAVRGQAQPGQQPEVPAAGVDELPAAPDGARPARGGALEAGAVGADPRGADAGAEARPMKFFARIGGVLVAPRETLAAVAAGEGGLRGVTLLLLLRGLAGEAVQVR